MGISEQTLNEIIERILKVAKPDRIIMFGSAATGTMTKDSDIDLLVVEREPGDVYEEMVRIHKVLRGLGFPFDVIVMSTKRFEGTKGLVGGIAYPANKYGRVIYNAA